MGPISCAIGTILLLCGLERLPGRGRLHRQIRYLSRAQPPGCCYSYLVVIHRRASLRVKVTRVWGRDKGCIINENLVDALMGDTESWELNGTVLAPQRVFTSA